MNNASSPLDGSKPAAAATSTDAHANLASHSARGLLYLFAGSGSTKIFAYVTQILVIYLVTPADIGIAAWAGTITSFILLIG